MLIITLLIHEHAAGKLAFQASPQKFGAVVTPAEGEAWLLAERSMMEGMKREGAFEPVPDPTEQPSEKKIIGGD